LVEALAAAGIGWARITLHVGYGTFKPVRAEQVEAHTMDAERYAISAETADAITSTRASGHRVVAVGTTTVRALESAADQGSVRAGEGRTALFIYPGHPVHPGQPGQPENPGHRGNPEDARRAGHQFQVVDALLTNFHLPRSSLLMLVCAFGGTALVRAAYDYAIAHEFRFYSYGDAMLIL
ncbi:MAG TPA: S-adenosylmethionine:tRNA ribosyltransferase-isomerase, partial [Thermoleophilia bacterium]|nr:S-adenosylmethionine:tRNA ribosyltransferase-isomerase [Thermoleophilia bacterium]